MTALKSSELGPASFINNDALEWYNGLGGRLRLMHYAHLVIVHTHYKTYVGPAKRALDITYHAVTIRIYLLMKSGNNTHSNDTAAMAATVNTTIPPSKGTNEGYTAETLYRPVVNVVFFWRGK